MSDAHCRPPSKLILITPLLYPAIFTGYVAAQYRFLVKPTGDYTAYFADADIYLNWGDILSVLIPTSSALSGASTSSLPAASQPSLESHEGAACPICLSPPTAPRMTKCGHVFCYSCILQYLATTEGPAVTSGPSSVPGAPPGASTPSLNTATGPTNRQWKRCPICWDAVYARDLKAVKWWDPQSVASHREDREALNSNNPTTATTTEAPADWLRMRLVERPQITTLALPQSSTWPTSSTSPSDQPLIAQHQAPWHFQPDVMEFAKFMLATPELLLNSLTQDIDELSSEKRLLSSMGAVQGDNTLSYIDLAERKVREQMAKVVNELDTPVVKSSIGHAKNDLKEHRDAERARQLREGEHLSRRRRRQAEKEQQAAQQAADEGKEAVSESNTVKRSEEDAAPKESTEGAEDFLALKSSNQGGSYISRVDDSASFAPTEEGAATSTPTKSSQRTRRNINPPNPSASSFLFYQASSGQSIFMHPLDIKIMHSHYGSYAKFPRDIAVKVQGAEEGSMNEELRKRCRYLTHLPKGTDVVFIEIDWEAMAREPTGSTTEDATQLPVVDKRTLKQYEQILRARRNKRRDKERREDRAKLKAEAAEAAKRPGGGASGPVPMMSRGQQGSGGRFDQDPPLSASYGSETAGSVQSSRQEDHDEHDDVHVFGEAASSPSFREAALWGAERDFPVHPGVNGGHSEDFPAVAPVEQSPRFGPVSAASPLQQAKTTVWGTPAARSSFASTVHASSRAGPDREEDNDIDDAWLELEEGFVLGTNNAKQVRQSRGLNTQQSQGQSKADSKGSGNGTFPKKSTASPAPGASSGEPVAPSNSSSAPPAGGKGKKQRKTKLVLTGGGRGTA